ncbi:hypothetical protein [Vibrio phage JSF12]|uniref:Uncharacterized protein n=2 Tax=Jesfedecavirus TaxID=2560156 RepID=A0A2D0Z8E8_9CAUD|nr:DNA ligase [Vibrio phage JSF10]YP_009794826.1 DNA ligase [Vibrio phage JSF12]ASV43438.1 hypothetical protein [Vibrio phage JSF10]ASV43661.1 hypothetical protein [Vibrio phage JSF12]
MEDKKEAPFSEEEALIMHLLAEAWNAFCKIESTHPCHTKDFADGIHQCQDILIHKMVQREYPGTFPTYKKNEK